MQELKNSTDLVDIEKLSKIAKDAGAKIMEIYAFTDFSGIVDFKADNSPLTLADKEANKIIEAGLRESHSFPIISEEGKTVPYELRSGWKEFWLVDPLDGTKEFIKRNGEFTVNIAFLKNNKPVIGVIYAPVLDILYVGIVGKGAYKIEAGIKSDIKTNQKKTKLIAIGSRSHASPEDESVLQNYDIIDKTSIGSSLKFCMLAEGKADLYFRSGPTMEWDTAAGQAILEAAGGKMYNQLGAEFMYNKESLLNGGFLCTGWN
ncbi:MAG TPA: 3'(2'),5'-bisphosphate nucleotidase CysQ [Cytophagaceae bacterium]|jgi:3'(2'), 5'-bisphosphate nucleotidase|nr:3'(2'),5'-bisphosphate nucleotidase CysQ [Cytophagaceae bacterium]